MLDSIMKNINSQGVECPLLSKNMTQEMRLHAVCSADRSIVLKSDPIPRPALQINPGLRVSNLRNVSLFSQFRQSQTISR